jgi:hypothetical protein
MSTSAKWMIVATLALGLGASHAEQKGGAWTVYEETSGLYSLQVSRLREENCGGTPPGPQRSQEEKNAAFIGCMMYVLGAVDMLRELQKIDPTHAPHICVPRTVPAGSLIVIVQENIEATAPWQKSQFDAATAVMNALRATWPCPRQ